MPYGVTDAAELAAEACGACFWGRRGLAAYVEEREAQAHLLRDVLGNLFRRARVAPAWLTPAVLELAQAAHDERLLPSGELDPARLAVLSDALEEAGCADADLLDHLRSAGPHVCGCWAVDLLLRHS